MKIMSMLLASAAVAAALASPAVAQTRNGALRQVQSPYDAYAATRPLINRPYNVYDTTGRYVGSDPDPAVRDQLARDPSQGD